ncbi:hypothetical protein [Methylophaga sp.]|uniref:hypothetical protein n=1 Tax=Methylophaga sp. TaxID=2024840 RepID=UPI003A8E0C0A
MTVFSINFENEDVQVIMDQAIRDCALIGEASIQYTDDGRAFFVSAHATADKMGFYIPCADKEEANNLADVGVVIFDGDLIFESLSTRRKELFRSQIAEEHEENTMLDEVIGILDLQIDNSSGWSNLPIKLHCLVSPIFLPHEINLLRKMLGTQILQ